MFERVAILHFPVGGDGVNLAQGCVNNSYDVDAMYNTPYRLYRWLMTLTNGSAGRCH
jgi:hypothetical protein